MIELGKFVKVKPYNEYGMVVGKQWRNDRLHWVVRCGDKDWKVYYCEDNDLEAINVDNRKILLVEDGSVDVDKLEQLGFIVVVYRQGAKTPILLER